MKIAIASNGDGRVAGHAGHCRQFDIYEAGDDGPRLIESRPNPNAATPCGADSHAGQGHGHGHGHGEGQGQGQCDGHGHGHENGGEHGHGSGQGRSHAGIVQTLGGCEALIARGMGPRLMTDLSARGLRAVICEATDGAAAAQAFMRGELSEAAGNPRCRHR